MNGNTIAETPVVSIGLRVHNAEGFLEKTLDSLISQTYENLDIVILDNGSTDGSGKICRRYEEKDRRIRYHRNIKDIGSPLNFNNAFFLSLGKYYLPAADHDLFHETYIEKCVEQLEADSNLVICYSRTQVIDTDDNPLGIVKDNLDTFGMSAVERFRKTMWTLNMCNILHGVMRSSAVARTEMFKAVKGADHIFLAEMSLHGTFFQIKEPLFSRRDSRPGETPEQVEKRRKSKQSPAHPGTLAVSMPCTAMGWEHMCIVHKAELNESLKNDLLGEVVQCFRKRFGKGILAEIEKVYTRCRNLAEAGSNRNNLDQIRFHEMLGCLRTGSFFFPEVCTKEGLNDLRNAWETGNGNKDFERIDNLCAHAEDRSQKGGKDRQEPRFPRSGSPVMSGEEKECRTVEGRLAHGEALFRQRRYDEARQVFLAVIEEGVRSADALNNLGVIEQLRGTSSEALGFFQKALALDPGHRTAALNMCAILEKTHGLHLAGPFLKRLSEIYPKDEEISALYRKSRQDSGGLRKKILFSWGFHPLGGSILKSLRESQDVFFFGPYPEKQLLTDWTREQLHHVNKPPEIVTGHNPDISEVLDQLPEGWVPELFLWKESSMTVPNFPRGIDRLSCPKACYLVDSHTKFAWHVKWARQFDFVFVAQKQFVERFREAGCKNVSWLPLACHPSINRRFEEDKIYDLAFVGNVYNGNCYGRREKYLEKLRGSFNTFIGKKYFEEMSRVFSRAKIVFNISTLEDMNARIFEAMASGSLLLTDEVGTNGMKELFTENVHYAVYKDEEELLEKVRYYLNHAREREQVALRGYEAVQNRHTYGVRVRQLLDTVFSSQFHPVGIQTGSRERTPEPPAIGEDEITLSARKRWAQARKAAGDPGYNYPKSYQIEPTTLCNLRCRMCSQSRWDDRKLSRGNMSFVQFKTIVDQIPNPRSFLLFQGLGEPFMNKAYIDMVRYASGRGFQIMTSTNGLLLDSDHMCESVVESGMKVVVYSVDTFDPEIYRNIRGADVTEAISSIHRMIQARKRLGRSFPKVQINVVGMPDTLPGLPYLVERAGEMGVDIVKIQEEREEKPDLDSCMVEEEAKKSLEQAKLISQRYKLILRVVPKIVPPFCKSIGNLCYISWNGYLTPCCGNFTGSNPLFMNFGNVLEKGLAQTWFSPEYQRVYNRLSNQDPPKQCLKCHVGVQMVRKRKEACAEGYPGKSETAPNRSAPALWSVQRRYTDEMGRSVPLLGER